jgi:hypothetical protein
VPGEAKREIKVSLSCCLALLLAALFLEEEVVSSRPHSSRPASSSPVSTLFTFLFLGFSLVPPFLQHGTLHRALSSCCSFFYYPFFLSISIFLVLF